MRARYAASLIDEGAAVNRRGAALRLVRLVTQYRLRLLSMPLLALVVAAASALAPRLIGQAVDQYIARGDSAGLARIIGLLAVVYAVGLVGRVLQAAQLGWLTQHLLYQLRQQIFDAISRQSMRFFDRHESGDLQSRLLNDVDAINTVLGQGLLQASAGVMSMTGIIVGMFTLNWRLALSATLVLPLMFLLTNILSGMSRRAYREARRTIGDVSANAQEDLAGIRVAQAFNRGEINQARFALRNRANRNANVNASAIVSAFAPMMEVLTALGVAIVVGYGAYQVINGQTTVGVVVSFVTYVLQLFLPISQIGQLLTLAQSGLAAADQIFALVDEPVAVGDPEQPRPLPRLSGQVRFEDVCFGYDENLVLHEVSLEAAPGQTVALVGPTGAGKTTIVSLVARFYDVTAGRVTVDGVDVREVAQADLRRQMGIVPQNGFLFDGTIRENIRYGRLEATDEEITRAAQSARAHEFIERLPLGYDTRVGDRGTSLSQGQRQLLAIARALLADPRILILDEATSSVDTRTEGLIQQALGELLKNRTSFVIAHRLSTIRDADVVCVIRDGRLVERGSHDELLALGGLYADLYRRQFRDTSETALAPAPS